MAHNEQGLARLHVLTLISILLAFLCGGLTTASVINDVNNMLRDTTTEMHGSRIGHGRYGGVSVVDNLENGMPLTNINNNDNSNYKENDFVGMQNEKAATADADLNKAPANGELLRFVDDNNADVGRDNDNDNDNDNDADADDDDAKSMLSNGSKKVATHQAIEINGKHLTLDEQVRLLSKQLNALLTRRREDYEILESNLRKSLRITTNAANVDVDIHNELEQLRHEVKSLRDSHLNGNRERLTVEWLQQSVSEIRKQLIELQQIASNTVTDVNRHKENYEDLATIRNDFQQLKLELAAIKERQEKTEVYVQELREEAIQQEEDFKRLLHNNEQHNHKNKNTNRNNKINNNNNGNEHENENNHNNHNNNTEQNESYEINANGLDNKDNAEQINELSTELSADHKRRHCRFQHQQLRQLHVAQHHLKRQLNELKYNRIADRIRNLEIEQHRIAGANFNLSRQIATFDKLHASMLQLLEDVEQLENKMDKNIPDLRHEISKIEFTQAQLSSGHNLVREVSKNTALSLQAMAVSVSTLLDEREGVKQMAQQLERMQMNFNKLKTLVEHVERNLKHRRHSADEKLDNIANQQSSTTINNGFGISTQDAETLVTKLENVEEQYEAILNKLPRDCSEIKTLTTTATATAGIFLIAPNEQHHPLMAHCTADGWTTIQRRYDGSADFNRSWVDYANGFGKPAGEYWIGNEQLHQLTLNNCTSLRIEMQDIYDNNWIAEYEQFYISTRSDGYRLHISGYSGNASDALNYQQGMQFSAIDDDRDISQTHCAANYEGGWWFSHCQHANLNGRYNLGLTWFDAARNEWIAVKSSQMTIKRKSAAVCEYVAAAAEASATTILSSKSTFTTTIATATATATA